MVYACFAYILTLALIYIKCIYFSSFIATVWIYLLSELNKQPAFTSFKLNVNIKTICEICLKLAIKTLTRRHLLFPLKLSVGIKDGVVLTGIFIFIVRFKLILHIALVFLLLILNKWMPAGIVKRVTQFLFFRVLLGHSLLETSCHKCFINCKYIAAPFFSVQEIFHLVTEFTKSLSR